MFDYGFPKEWSTLRKLAWLYRTVINAVSAVLKTVTGNPIHITDALAKPAQALSVKLEPIQDLHGYDAPWPAGGGANLLDLDKASYNSLAYGLTVSRDGDGVRITGTVTQSGNLSFNLIVDYSDETLGGKGYVLQVFDVTSGYTVSGAWGFRTESERAFAISLSGMTVGQVVNCFMKLSVAETSQTSWTPYSNICPISGHTDADVVRTGKNLLRLVESEMTNVGWNREFPFSIKAGTYTLSCQNKFVVGSFDGCQINLRDDNNNNIATITTGYNFGNVEFSKTSVITEEMANAITKILFQPRASGCTFANIMDAEIMFELGSTATSYEPYVGTTYPIPLGQTVYGGTDDVINGNGSDEWTKLKLLSSFSWQMDGTTGNGKRFGLPYASNPSIVKAINQNNTYISNVLAPYNIGLNTRDFGSFYISSSWIVVHDNNSHFETLADFKAWLDSEDVYLVYKVATPTTFTHTPTQVELLQGENNIWSDGTMTLTYLADGNASDVEALNILLGGRYVNNHTEDEPTDREALDILLGQ